MIRIVNDAQRDILQIKLRWIISAVLFVIRMEADDVFPFHMFDVPDQVF
jgi:hypothetical protein